MNYPNNVFLLRYIESLGWTQFPLKHYWTLGFQIFPTLMALNELPARVSSTLKRLLDVIDLIAEDSSKRLKDIFSITGCKLENRQTYADMLVHSMMEEEHALAWEEEIRLGLIRITFDPSSQIRDMVFANSKAARFWMLSQEIFIEQITNNDLQTPYTELDWLISFVVYARTYFNDTLTQFNRFTFGGEASLVSVTFFKKRDSFGRISEVPHTATDLHCLSTDPSRLFLQIKTLLREISPDEYDDAIKHSPSCCPLVLIGDHRSGRQLLADAALDTAQTIESLSQSCAGRAALEGVAGYLEAELAAIERVLECEGNSWRPLASGPLQAVQRPLAYNLSALTFDRESPLIAFMGHNQLAQVKVLSGALVITS